MSGLGGFLFAQRGSAKLDRIDIFELEKRIREADLQALKAYKEGKGGTPLLYKPSGYYKGLDAEGKIPVFVASEESPDRVGDVVIASGWQLDAFRKNPVYLFSHNHYVPPIGTVPKVWVEGNQLLNTVKFDEEDEFARQIKGKFDRGILRAESVGFMVLEFEELAGKGIKSTKQELVEISAVTVPAHPHALIRAMMAMSVAPFYSIPTNYKSLLEKPLPNEHACRLRDPGDFQEDSFRRDKREHEGKEYSIIMGRLKGETTMTEQSYRYDKGAWTAAQAGAHCKAHEGNFEAAEGETGLGMEIPIHKDMDALVGMMRQCQELLGRMVEMAEGMMGGAESGPPNASPEDGKKTGLTPEDAERILQAITALKEG